MNFVTSTGELNYTTKRKCNGTNKLHNYSTEKKKEKMIYSIKPTDG